ncbi:MAG: tetratricopeptide repeat protein [Candidatus Aureabacteria bacterium]|nr:tetratricopeptide repeat protein [Candidatus Auribacterota bacterium]
MLKKAVSLCAVFFLFFTALGYGAEYNFGDESSKTLSTKAWSAFQTKDYDAVTAYADKCVSLFSKKALEQQASLTDFAPADEANNYWALNDVGACLFVKGKALKEQGKNDEAKKVFQSILDNYGYAQCWDPQGWFWKVADASKDELLGMESGVDFGNMKSETLVSKAWEALVAGRYDQVNAYVDKTLQMYDKKAKEMQSSLQDFPTKEKAFDYWALNDVGTILFIKAKSLQAQGKNEEAKKVYNKIMKDYTYAQSWDPQGWFWKVADSAQDQILIMEAGIDFGDYTSETLTVKAWQALGSGDYDASILYAKKCVQLYKKLADEQQSKLDGYLPKEKAFDAWALNDVGTCYFIMGDAYMGKNDAPKALESYKILVDKYFYAQCWDTKGWFWKPAVAARGKINKIASERGLIY